MTNPAGPQRRVRVTSPLRDAPHRSERRTARAEIEAQTSLGTVYIDDLVAAQRRLGIACLVTILTLIAGIPVLLMVAPGLREISLWWLPLPWLVVGLLLYPALWLTSHVYTRQSERIERDFADLISQSP